ncbi:MAG: hypothetical protein JWM39_788 [Parcubacteria group bacterium]|nr:hypothetical protein [Parcubacteria group bacterium]
MKIRKLEIKKNRLLAGAIVASALAVALFGANVARADTTVQNSNPSDNWFYGTGNGYTPANTEVLSTSGGDQLYLRMHDTFQTAPASSGGVYDFATSAGQFVSYDWGFDDNETTPFAGTATLTFTNLAGGSFSYNALALGNDNSVANGSTQNSYRLNFLPGLNFDPAINGTYDVKLTVTGLAGGTKSLTTVAQLGTGFAGSGAVPEPATWAMMLVGFGGLGAVLRRRRASTSLAAA